MQDKMQYRILFLEVRGLNLADYMVRWHVSFQQGTSPLFNDLFVRMNCTGRSEDKWEYLSQYNNNIIILTHAYLQ